MMLLKVVTSQSCSIIGAYVKDDPDWWQECQGEEVIYIPEFEGLMKYVEFKKLVDKSNYKLRVKGGHATSNRGVSLP